MEKFGKERNVRHKMGSKNLWEATHLKVFDTPVLKVGFNKLLFN